MNSSFEKSENYGLILTEEISRELTRTDADKTRYVCFFAFYFTSHNRRFEFDVSFRQRRIAFVANFGRKHRRFGNFRISLFSVGVFFRF